MAEIINTPEPAAAAVAANPIAAQIQQYLTFILGEELFAIGILSIKEIIEYTQVTRVPMMPDYLRGVINLRGAVVPVADLNVRFGRAPSPVTKKTCVVIIEIRAPHCEPQDVGIVVDSVDSVIDIAATDIEPPPAFGARVAADFIQGMGRINDRFVILLAVNFVLGIEEMALLRQSDPAAQPALS